MSPLALPTPWASPTPYTANSHLGLSAASATEPRDLFDIIIKAPKDLEQLRERLSRNLDLKETEKVALAPPRLG